MGQMKYLYRCVPSKERNNGLLKKCTFELVMPEGTHHCPCCGNFLTLATQGKSVTQLMREGLEAERKNKG